MIAAYSPANAPLKKKGNKKGRTLVQPFYNIENNYKNYFVTFFSNTGSADFTSAVFAVLQAANANVEARRTADKITFFILFLQIGMVLTGIHLKDISLIHKAKKRLFPNKSTWRDLFAPSLG